MIFKNSESALMAKQAYLISYNTIGFFMAVYILTQITAEATGITELRVNSYAKRDSWPRFIFKISELMVIFEVVNSIIGLQNMKRHIVFLSAWSIFIVFGVIPFFNTH